MPKKMGRPVIGNPLEKRIGIRVDLETFEKLEECCKTLNKSKSEVVRMSIELLDKEVKK